jgi:hypothetical protein
MEIRRDDLDAAAHAGVISAAQADALWTTLSVQATASAPAPAQRAGSGLRDAAILAAAVVTAAPAAWLLFAAWERWGAAPAVGVAGAVAAIFLGGARAHRRGAPGAPVLVTAALVLLPLAVHAAEHWLGYAVDATPATELGDWLLGHHVPVIAATAASAAIALRVVGAPILSALLVAVSWFAAMDAAPAIFGPAPTWTQHALLSAVVGLLALGTGFALDGRTRRDHAGWLYLAGLVALWGGLTTSQAASRTSVVLYVVVQLWLLATALLVRRRAFAILGVIGLAGATGHAAEAALVPEALPAVLAAIAAAVVGGALLWLRFETRANQVLVAALPPSVRRLLPPGRRRERPARGRAAGAL